MLVYCSLGVCNLFIRAGNRGRWPASVKLVTLPFVLLEFFPIAKLIRFGSPRLAPSLILLYRIFELYLLLVLRRFVWNYSVVEEIESSTPTIYGSTDEGDALRQTNNGVYQSPNVSDAECSKWELNYREAALYLKVDCFEHIALITGHKCFSCSIACFTWMDNVLT